MAGGRRAGTVSGLNAAAVERRVARAGDPVKARFFPRFFKTGPGEYGEGDKFAGVTVPAIRKLAREYQAMPLAEVARLMSAALHEARLLALLILVRRYGKGDDKQREAIFRLYLRNKRRINNWDLVDSSAPQIVGAHLEGRDQSILDDLAHSASVWDRRIAMIATQHFIRKGNFAPSLRIASILVSDEHDLIHKAVGWMLREIGKRDLPTEEMFLAKHYRKMPRTMLRYAIEKFPELRRKAYLDGKA
jgi:3-methyladenine DNA glycosylase AlkD